MRVAFFTLGCKVNQYETEVLTENFFNAGFTVVSPDDIADIYVLNSCTVTGTSDKKNRQTLHRFKKTNPSSIVVLTGCMPQAYPDIADKFPEADIITGSNNRANIVPSVLKFLQDGERIVDITPYEKEQKFERMKAENFSEKTRAFLKIQDGCDRYCSYCIIPTARGPIRFKSLDDIRDEVKVLAQNGYKEIVLVGINLSLYGKGTDLRLIDAIKAVCEIDGTKRVRLGSLEPELLLKEDIDEMAKLDKFCPQFHLSLQSGCDETLKRMNRHYTTSEYMHIVDMIREAFPNPAITTDIMVGFAGETDEEFSKSLQFAKDVGFAKVHTFAYSIRKNTRAERMENQVSRAVKSQRSRIMIRETEVTRQEFLKSQIGLISDVLFETMENGKNTGYTKNYCPVLVDVSQNLAGQIKKVKIIGTDGDFCIGELI